MSKIRRIAPKNCPECKAPGSLFVDDDRRLTCRNCGYKQGLLRKEQPRPRPPKKRFNVSYGMPNSPDVSAWEKTKYFTAMDHVDREEYDEALQIFKVLANDNKEFIDALNMMAAERNLDRDQLLVSFEEALEHAFERNVMPGRRIEVVIDPESGDP